MNFKVGRLGRFVPQISIPSPESVQARRKGGTMTDHTRARVELAALFLRPILIVLGFIGVFYV